MLTNKDYIINSSVHKAAIQMANNDNFIKNWTFEMIKNYAKIFSNFMEINKFKIEELAKNMSKKEKNIFSKQLNFFSGILRLINFEDNLVELNWDFLNKHFKLMKSSQQINEWNSELKKISKILLAVPYEKEKISLIKLYNFSNSILTFLKNENFRIEIAEDILNKTEYKKDEVDNFKEYFLNKQNDNWKNKSLYL